MGLSVDEAHYLLYAARPALSYFDHPPLVGWVQWPLVVLNAPVWLLRLLPGVFWVATVVGVSQLAMRLHPGAAAAAAGEWAALALIVAPLVHVLGVGLLPDSLLMLWTVALMHQTLTLCDGAQVHKLRGWACLGLLMGLAGLSKYTAVLLVAPVVLCLIASHSWYLLRLPGPWLAVALALVCISPVLLWNAQHQWMSFAYQLQHGAGSTWQAEHVLRFLIFQVLTFGPLLWWGLAHHRSPTAWLMSFFVMPMAVFALMSGGGSGLPHWTAPAWVALAPLAGGPLASAWQAGRHRLLASLVVVQAAACMVAPALMVAGGLPRWQPNPFADLHGWDAAGLRASQLARARGIDSLAVSNWTLGSRLGWYARPLAVHVLDERVDQFDLWVAPLPKDARTLWVNWSQLPHTLPEGPEGFRACTLLESQSVVRWGRTLAQFDFYDCNGWSGRNSLAMPSARVLKAS